MQFHLPGTLLPPAPSPTLLSTGEQALPVSAHMALDAESGLPTLPSCSPCSISYFQEEQYMTFLSVAL